MTINKWKHYPIDKAKSAQHDGLVMCFRSRYWVAKNGNLLFWGNSPQCNSNQELTKRCAKQGSEIVYLEYAYIPCSETHDGIMFDLMEVPDDQQAPLPPEPEK